MNKLQGKLLEILEWFHAFCEKENLTYYIAYGTVLGAVRHHGFIPWDDDIDVCMPRPDYERCKELFSTAGNRIGKYMLETPYMDSKDYFYVFNKLFDTQTTVIERLKKDFKRGTYLDIFPLDGAGDTMGEALKHYRSIDWRHMFLMTRVCAIRKERAFFKNAAIFLSRLIPLCFVDEKALARKIDGICRQRDYDAYEYICEFMGPYRSKAIMSKRMYGKPTLYEFEGKRLYGPEHAEEYLTHIYGDWRKLPPVEKRGVQHDRVYLDLEHSFLDD